jgi:hypothetical protein
MKTIILALVILAIPYLVNAQVSKNDLKGKIGISLYGGPNVPTNGNYSANVNTTELLSTGSQFGIGVSYFITRGFGVEGSLYGGYNYYRDKYKPAGKDPVWVNYSASLNAIYNFGHLFRNPVVSPFVRIGAGKYGWEHFEDGITNGDVTKESNNHEVKSFGFNAGVGADLSLKKNFTIGLILDYNMYFPKEESLAGSTNISSDRTSHGYFAPQIKFSYYIPTR